MRPRSKSQGPRPAVSLRAGRNFVSRPKIAGPIDDKIKQIKELETNHNAASREAIGGPEGGSRETLGGIPHYLSEVTIGC